LICDSAIFAKLEISQEPEELMEESGISWGRAWLVKILVVAGNQAMACPLMEAEHGRGGTSWKYIRKSL